MNGDCGHVPVRGHGQYHQADEEEDSRGHDGVNHLLLIDQVHEIEAYQTALDGRNGQTNRDVQPVGAKVVVCHNDSQDGAGKQDETNRFERLDGLENFFFRVSSHKLHEVKDWEEEDPDEIHKVPEQTRDLNTIGEALWLSEPHFAAG